MNRRDDFFSLAMHKITGKLPDVTEPVGRAAMLKDPSNLELSQLFSNNGTGYAFAETLQPGNGYRVKINASGIFILVGADLTSSDSPI